MRKILFSWLGVEKDFINFSVINMNGPTWNLYKYRIDELDIDFHVLLVTPEFIHLGKKFKEKAEEAFGRRVQVQVVDVEGVHYNLQGIVSALSPIMLKYKKDFVYIFLSTGSGIMKIAWYVLYSSLGLNSKIIQILKTEESKGGRPELLTFDMIKSSVPYSLLINQQISGQEDTQEVILTPTLAKVYNRARYVAETDNISVLIIGETGTGKEQLARYIHKQSARSRKPFRAINCAAFSDQLLESRLFGYAKGSFTGAYRDTKGLFEQANNGTVFLDEIGDISPYMQQALLRFLQEKEIQPIGKPAKKVNVRILTATNKPVDKLLQGGEFRTDLFYRLGVVIELPPLRNYPPEEKAQIIEELSKRKASQFGKKQLKFCPKLETFFLTYAFPGNFRELLTILDNLYIFSEDQNVCNEHLPYHLDRQYKSITRLKDMERDHILNVYQMFGGVKKRTADALDISLNTLKNKLREYGVIE